MFLVLVENVVHRSCSFKQGGRGRFDECEHSLVIGLVDIDRLQHLPLNDCFID